MVFIIFGYVVNCPGEMAKELQEMEKNTVVNWFDFNVGTNYYSVDSTETYKCSEVDHENKIIKFITEEEYKSLSEFKEEQNHFGALDGGESFVKPEKPFMLVYESEKDGLSIAWLETEEDMMETIEEVKSYGDTIVDAIEIESCRDVNTDEI